MRRKENQLLANLTKEECKRLQPYMEQVDLEFNQRLVEFNKPIKYVWFPEDCVTSTIVDSLKGVTIEVGLMGTEGIVGLSLLYEVERSNATVTVMLPGRATRMRADHFKKYVVSENGPFVSLLRRYANFFAVMVGQHAACNTVHTVEQRMCRWILLTHDRVGQDGFPLTQEYLSKMLGVRRPPLSKLAGKLKREGLIDYTRGNLTVTDRKGLERRSCECYGIIKEQDRLTFNGKDSRRGARK
jgi:CRP-like cAMP-binding protein